MEISGSQVIQASRLVVWSALNDADVLRLCIPGCEVLERVSADELTASVTSKIGPVKAKFKGSVTFENVVSPESYTIVGEGKGGVAGFAKGSADIRLVEDGDATVLSYEAKAQVGGKLAQLGSRLIDSTARKMAEEFFSRFTEQVGGSAAAVSEVSSDTGLAADLDEGVAEEAKRIALEEAPGEVLHAIGEAEHKVEEGLHKAEENLEDAAGRNAFGGPMVWGLLLLGALIVVLALAS